MKDKELPQGVYCVSEAFTKRKGTESRDKRDTNYGFIIKAIELNGLYMHLSYRLGSLNKEEQMEITKSYPRLRVATAQRRPPKSARRGLSGNLPRPTARSLPHCGAEWPLRAMTLSPPAGSSVTSPNSTWVSTPQP